MFIFQSIIAPIIVGIVLELFKEWRNHNNRH